MEKQISVEEHCDDEKCWYTVRQQDVPTAHTNGSFVGDDNSSVSGLSVGPQKTVVSFVIGDDEDNDNASKQGSRKKKDENDAQGHSRSYLLSFLYAFMVILVGLCLPVTEALQHRWYNHHVVGAFMTYLFGVALIFIIYIQVVTSTKKKKEERKEHHGEDAHTPFPRSVSQLKLRRASSGFDPLEGVNEEEEGHDDVDKNMNSSVVEKNYKKNGLDDMVVNGGKPKPNRQVSFDGSSMRRASIGKGLEESSEMIIDQDEIKEYIAELNQTATQSDHGASLYLRFGCLIFAIANLLYIALEIQYQRTMEGRPECENKRTLLYPICLHLVFLLLQTFFLFKNSTIMVGTRHKIACRFGLMHLIATNMCVWLRILVREIMEGIEGNHFASFEEMEYGVDEWDIFAGPEAGGNGTYCYDDTLLHEASPYLFPFVLEYSLIALATFIGMFASLDVAVTKDVIQSVKKAIMKARMAVTNPKPSHDSHHEPTLARSHIGLFFGIIVLAGQIVTIVLFYHWNNIAENSGEQYDIVLPSILYHSTDMAAHLLMFIVVIIGLTQLFKLAFSITRVNTIDDVLLLISFAGLVLLEVFNMIANFEYIDSFEPDLIRDLAIMHGSSSIMQILQAVIQTIFIIDGLQRYPKKRKHLKDKPGRGCVTFLVITNLSMWIFKSFQIKQILDDISDVYFGRVAWAIILNITLPLMVFYRFHSSVCLAHIWFAAYEEDDDDEIYDIHYLE